MRFTGALNDLFEAFLQVRHLRGHITDRCVRPLIVSNDSLVGSQVGVGLPYSRSLESRADEGGLMLMAKAGYNPQSAITLWEKMAKQGGAQGSALLSTHPTDSQRIEKMRKNLAAAQAIYNARR